MTEQEIKDEWNYRYQERLGLDYGDRKPTKEERAKARADTDSAMAALLGPKEPPPLRPIDGWIRKMREAVDGKG